MSTLTGAPLREQLAPLIATGFVEDGAAGVVVHRIPAAVRRQIADPFFDLALSQPSGVELRFVTAAPEVRLRVSATAAQLIGWPEPAVGVVVRDGADEQTVALPARVEWMDLATGVATVTDGEVAEIVIRPTSAERPVTVLLPHNATLEIHSVESAAPLVAASDDRRVWLHYGSSISHCSDAVSPATTWPMQVADRFGLRLHSLGMSGQARLDPPVARFMAGAVADVITLKVGINIVGAGSMRGRTFRTALHGFIDQVRDGHPDTPIVVISAIADPALEDAAGPGDVVPGRFLPPPADRDPGPDALTLALSREIVREVVALRSESDANLRYLDGLELFSVDDAHLLFDDLHPDQAGMDLIAARFIDAARGWGWGR